MIKTTQQFIDDSRKIHGDKYDYTNTIYIVSSKKLSLICRIHGEFYQSPNSHLRGQGCKQCGIYNRGEAQKNATRQNFIEKANKVHNNLYNYDKFVYDRFEGRAIINCPTHGEFLQSAKAHLGGAGCSKCGVISPTNSRNNIARQDFKEKAKKIHGDKYDYSETEYKDNRLKVTINCKIHGSFLQTPANHLSGRGCTKCGYEKVSEICSVDPNGWSLGRWKEKAKSSDNFDSFKVYLFECFNDTEKFYKIGRTYRVVSSRIRGIPYNVNVIHTIYNKDSEVIFHLENELKRRYKNYKYLPKIYFAGMRECFSLELPISDIIANYPTNYTPPDR
jgi:hypothetical protein